MLTGSNDGSVRIWDGIFEANDELSRSKPSLVSSFFAAPDIVSDQRYSSGLVLEFQQCGGQLIAGGNTKTIRCWDIATEQCRNTFDSKTGASLTTLTTAWNYDAIGGYSGIGPDIVVAGYGNGSLRVFDTRLRNGEPDSNLNDGRTSASRRRWRYSEFDEHTSWIVDLSFTNYGGRYEVNIFLNVCLRIYVIISFFLYRNRVTQNHRLQSVLGGIWLCCRQHQILGLTLLFQHSFTGAQNADDRARSTFQCPYVCNWVSGTVHKSHVT